MRTPVVYRFTVFERDGVTPWFGSVDDYGEVIEPSFQTPDSTFPHDRPYLRVPEGFSPTEVDFLNGSSRIGTGSVGVLDKRTTASDQRTGIVSSRIKDASGARAVLERWDDGAATWRTILDGKIASISVDTSELVVYWFHLRDARDFERDQPLFVSNHVVLGRDFASGPPINYGQKGGFTGLLGSLGRFLTAVQPFESVNAGGINHFALLSDPTPADGIYWGKVALGDFEGWPGVNLAELGNPVPDTAGVFRYQEVWVRWRAQGTSDPWVELRAMPRAEFMPLVEFANIGASGPIGGTPTFFGTIQLYLGSEDPDQIPADEQEIELQVIAVRITENTPFWWDGGTLGDLLEEIVAGEHTEEPPKERYDTAALAAFALSSRPARFVLRQPVTDRRRWVEENIYKASFTAPAFNLDQELRPRGWRIPALGELAGAPILDLDSLKPIGEFQHGIDNAVAAIEYTYIRESLAPVEQIAELKEETSLVVKVQNDARRQLNADAQVEPWRRLVETPVTVRVADPDATPGGQTLVYAPVTIRSIGAVDGTPWGPDTQDELGNLLAEEAIATVFPRFRTGAPKFTGEAVATAANRTIAAGDWVRVRAPWLPSYERGRRGLSRWMQVYGVSDPSPGLRLFLLIDGMPDYEDDPDIVDPTGPAACLTVGGGGESVLLPNGQVGFVFTSAGTISNICGAAVTIPRALLVAGGGGGGVTLDVGGGGGAGGVLELTDIVIGPGETVDVVIGEGGAAGSPGEDTVVWVDPAGTALDPMIDDPNDTVGVALGGGEGDMGSGGSGGGASESLPISGGGVTAGGAGTSPQGNAGGSAASSGGIATCQGAAGGGGGSYASAGIGGSAAGSESIAGVGAPSTLLEAWGVTVGGGGHGGVQAEPGALGPLCGDAFANAGAAGDAGFGYGGGGHADTDPATPGGDGIVVFAFAGAAPPELEPPVPDPATVTDQNGIQVCVSAANWPTVAPANYRVRVDYAVSTLEPAAESGDWRVAGYIEGGPGCVTTPPIPTGEKGWTRTVAEGDGFAPSEPSTGEDTDTPETPGLLEGPTVTIDADGVATVTWTPNAFATVVRIRGMIHAAGDDTSRPLAFIADVLASAGEYVLPGTVTQGEYYTVDVEAWEAIDEPASEPLVADDFDNGGVTTTDINDASRGPGAGSWTERGTVSFQLVGDTLRMSGGAGTPLSVCENTAVSRGEMFLQSKVLMSSGSGAESQLVGRFAWGAGVPDGYFFTPTTTGWRLTKIVAGVETDIDTQADGTIVSGTLYAAQLYLADGVQQASANGQTLNAADTAHDGQNARSAAAKFRRSSGTATCTWDDFLAFPTKHVVCSGLPTGWKAQVRNAVDAVVAVATEVGGVATVDCSVYGGATEVVPMAGWDALVLVDAADVEQIRWDGSPIYPGLETAYNQSFDSFGELVGEGRTYRESEQRPVRALLPARGYQLGDLVYADADGLLTKLAGNITATRKFLRQTGTGAVSSAPAWDTLLWADVDKAGSSLADLATRSAAALTSGNLDYARLPTGGGTWALGAGTDLTMSQAGVFLSSAGFGRLVLGSTNEDPILNSSTKRLLVHSTNTGPQAATFVRWANLAAGTNNIMAHSRGTTVGSYTKLVPDDTIGSFTFVGSDGVDLLTEGARIAAVVTATVNASRMPTALEFRTAAGAADDDVAPTMRLTGAGDLAINALAKLRFDGYLGTGNTYIHESASDTLQMVVGGIIALELKAATVVALLPAGTATRAPLGFTTGTNLTAAVAGRMEYNNTFHLTDSDGTRRHVVLAASSTKVTAAAPYVNDGYVTVRIGGVDVKLMTTA